MKNLFFPIIVGILYASGSSAQNQDLIQKMEISMLKKQQDSVIYFANSILKLDSTKWLPHYYLGKVYQEKHAYFEAINHFERANYLDSANSAVENALADSYDFIGKDEDAIQIYYNQYLRDTLKLEPIVKLANIFRKKGEFGSSIHYYQKANAFEPTNFYYYKQLAYCYDKINIPQGAIMGYKVALDLNPYDLSMYIQLANILNSERDFKSSIKICKQGLSYFNDEVQLLKLKSYAHYLNREFDSSIVGFNKLINLGDSSYFNLKYQGLSYFEKRAFNESAKSLNSAVDINDKDAETYFYLGSAYGRIGESVLGLRYLNKSQKLLEPLPRELSNIFSELAFIYQDQEKYQLALDHLKKAYKYNSSPLLSFKMAQLYDYFLDNKKMAINYYEGYLIMTNSPDSLMQESSRRIESFYADSAMISNANNRIRILKEEQFFEDGKKEKD